jgi:hypothetical protein
MKRWEAEAVRLKYEGKTYREIATYLSKMLAMVISPRTIEDCFAADGRLYLNYVTYETKQNNWSEEHSKQEHKRLSANTAKMRMQLLKEAYRARDWRLALDIIKDIDDRAGNVVVRKNENKEVKKSSMTYDEYLAECKRLGVSPTSGLPPAAEKLLQN